MTADGITGRLHELMGEEGPAAFARKCGIPDSSMRQYLKGSIPGADKAAQIADRNGVTLQWLITGEGPQFPAAAGAPPPAAAPGFAEDQAPYSAGPDPELFGRIVDRIAKVHREEGVRLADIDLGRLAAERYAEIVGLAADPEEWPGFLEVIAARVRKAIRAAAADPANVKREA